MKIETTRFGYGAASGNAVLGNLIGTDVSGADPLGNLANGVEISGASDNTIGGTTAAARNVISANTTNGVDINGSGSTGNIVAGNFIGTDPTGTESLPNGTGIIIEGPNNTVGGTTAAACNVISGNTYDGIDITGSTATGNSVQGNIIGLSADGSTALPNQNNGITISRFAKSDRRFDRRARNVISGNVFTGITVFGVGDTGNAIQGNYVGTDALGTTSIPNGSFGVSVGDAQGTLIGGLSPGDRNIISGGDRDGVGLGGIYQRGTQVLGNWIGLDVNGNALPNALNGIYVNAGSGDLIEDNVISANHGLGIDFDSTSNNTIGGNLIGTDPSGTTATDSYSNPLGNRYSGVVIQSGSTDNIIGGTAPGAGNVISRNDGDGIAISEAGTTGNVVLGNLIGTDISGTKPLGNINTGIAIFDASRGQHHRRHRRRRRQRHQ